MNDQAKITAYLEKQSQWENQLNSIRTVLQKTEMTETVKWGVPAYTVKGRTVISIAGFKSHCAIWFQQGVFLKDEERVLFNAQAGTTKGLRQWRFEPGEKVNNSLLKAYVLEAIENEKTGKQIKAEKKQLVLSAELKSALTKDQNLEQQFASLTPGKQREYADHIGAAKQEKTRLSRLDKAIPMIKAGVGLNDKYKHC